MTVFAYYRVSTSDQDYNSQKLGVVEYCKRNGHHIDKEIIDDGVSGCVKAKNRNLWKIVQKAKKFDLLVTSEMSRIGRSLTDVLETLKILSDKGVQVYFVKQNMCLDYTPMGKMTTAILAAFSELERDLIIQRTKEGIARAKMNGKRIGRPFGAENVKEIDFDKLRLLEKRGLNMSEIGRAMKVHRNTVTRYLKKLHKLDAQPKPEVKTMIDFSPNGQIRTGVPQ